MMIYAELIDDLAERIYKIATKPDIQSYDLGQLNAYKDLRRELLIKMDAQLNDLAIDAEQ